MFMELDGGIFCKLVCAAHSKYKTLERDGSQRLLAT